MRLIDTNTNLKLNESLYDLLNDLGNGENGFLGTNYGENDFEIETYLETLIDESNGINLKPGYVAQTTCWFMDENNRIIAMSRIRHELTTNLLNDGGNVGYYVKKMERGKGFGTELLRQTIVRAREIGINHFLLTPRSSNQASIALIEKNGGLMEDERISDNEKYRRYWIRDKER